MPARASGFCVYDDPAIAIAWLLLTMIQVKAIQYDARENYNTTAFGPRNQ